MKPLTKPLIKYKKQCDTFVENGGICKTPFLGRYNKGYQNHQKNKHEFITQPQPSEEPPKQQLTENQQEEEEEDKQQHEQHTQPKQSQQQQQEEEEQLPQENYLKKEGDDNNDSWDFTSDDNKEKHHYEIKGLYYVIKDENPIKPFFFNPEKVFKIEESSNFLILNNRAWFDF